MKSWYHCGTPQAESDCPTTTTTYKPTTTTTEATTTTTVKPTTTTTAPTVITLPCEKVECVHGSTTTTVQQVRCGENGVQCSATSTSFVGSTTTTATVAVPPSLPNTGVNDGPVVGSALIFIVLGAVAAVKLRKVTRA